MKILIVTPTFLPIMGGAELGVYRICRHLAGTHAVCILAPRTSNRLSIDYGIEGDSFDQSSFKLIRYADRFNLKNAPGRRLLHGWIPPFSFSLAVAALRQARSFRPDVMLAFYALPSGLAAVRVRKKLGIPVLLSLIGRDVPGPDIPEYWGNYVRWSMRSVDRTLFISEYCRQAAGGDRSSTSDVIPFGIDYDSFACPADSNPVRENLGIPPKAKVLLAVQRLDPWKRVDVLVRAMDFLREKTDACLVIVGKGPELPKLKRIVEELRLSSRVFFAGYIPERELPLYYAMADLFVFHSDYETFCLSLLQAMAAGKPIVSVCSTAIPELIHHGENGLLVEPGDAVAFARSILELLADEGMQRCFSAESRKRVLANYDWKMVSRQYESALEQCVRHKEKVF